MSCKWITAHSGCENTQDNSEENIRAAVASGADVLEIDIRRINGTLLLTHNLPENGESCVTLEECFRLTAKLSDTIRINCDLKEEGLEQDVLTLAEKNGLKGRIILTGTVCPEILPELPKWAMVYMNVENLLPGLYEALSSRSEEHLTAEEEDRLLQEAKHRGITSLNMHYPLFHEGLCKKMADAGIFFSLWTANDAETLRHLLTFDLENITTRLPVLACRMRKEMERSPAL